MQRAKFILSICLLFLCSSPCFSFENAKAVFSSGEAKVSLPFGKSYDYNDILIKRVIDGDTIQLENGEKVRLIGIDTPEMHESEKLFRDSRKANKDVREIKELGERAYQFTRKLLEGKRVRLELDVEKRDKYSRLLAYVFLKDGTFANAEIVKQGYASLLTMPPNVKYAGLFTELCRQARENRRGLWE